MGRFVPDVSLTWVLFCWDGILIFVRTKILSVIFKISLFFAAVYSQSPDWVIHNFTKHGKKHSPSFAVSVYSSLNCDCCEGRHSFHSRFFVGFHWPWILRSTNKSNDTKLGCRPYPIAPELVLHPSDIVRRTDYEVPLLLMYRKGRNSGMNFVNRTLANCFVRLPVEAWKCSHNRAYN